jgi:hypothetical protein
LPKLYSYVGPETIRQRVSSATAGVPIDSAADFTSWVLTTKQSANPSGLIAVTFVVDEQERLFVADRHSEHISCSGGRPVLTAGEMFFSQVGRVWEVVEVSNQSTGFCPEPESWSVVAGALDRAGISHPGQFTLPVIFRRCPACGERNIVKAGWFVCGVCGEELPAEWNFEEGS